MYQPLGTLLTTSKPRWTEGDVRALLQEYLQKALRTDRVVCEKLVDGVAQVTVPTPLLKQEVYLLVEQLKNLAKEQAGYTLTRVRARLN